MSEQFSDSIKRNTIRCKQACVGLTHFVGAFGLYPLPFCIFLQHISYLSACDSFTVPNENVVALSWNLLQKFDGFWGNSNKTVKMCLGVVCYMPRTEKKKESVWEVSAYRENIHMSKSPSRKKYRYSILRHCVIKRKERKAEELFCLFLFMQNYLIVLRNA